MSDKAETQTYWQEVMSQHKDSGQTQKQFCEANGICYRKFKYHRYQNTPAVKAKLNKSNSQTNFTEIKIKPDPSSSTIQIKYPNGCECYLPSKLPAETIAVILRGVSAC